MTHHVAHIPLCASKSLDALAQEKGSVNELSSLCANLISRTHAGSAFSFADLGRLYVAAVQNAPSRVYFRDDASAQEKRAKKIAFEEYLRVVFTNVYFDRTLARLSPEKILEKECVAPLQKPAVQSASLTSLLEKGCFEETDLFYAKIGKAVAKGAKTYANKVRIRRDEVRSIPRLKYKLDEEYNAVYREVKKLFERRKEDE